MKKPLFFIFLMLFSIYGFGQWSGDPNVNTLISNGVDDYGEPVTVSDGAGGIVTVFFDSKTLFVQKLSATGIRQWAGIGVQLSNTSNDINHYIAVTDGSGGIVVIYAEDDDNSNLSKIYAQRIDNLGAKVWGASGIQLKGVSGEYKLGDVISDGLGNYVFSYDEEGTGKNFVQKISSGGAVLWGSGTQLVDPLVTGTHSSAILFQDGLGFKCVWYEGYEINNQGGERYYWQKINADGTKNGSNVLIENLAPGSTEYFVQGIASDGSGGVYLLTIGYNVSDAKLYLQRILNDGTKSFTATTWGIEVDASIGYNVVDENGSNFGFGASLIADGAGGVIVGWNDTRSAKFGLYAQRFSGSGAKLWNSLDVTVAPEFVTEEFVDGNIKVDQDGNFLFLVHKTKPNLKDQLYVQKLSSAGTIMYNADGVLAAAKNSYKGSAGMAVSGDKVVLVWEGTDVLSRKIYAQSVFSNGTLPVKFAGFNAAYANGTTKLTWTTATETNNDYFAVERSEDGVNFVVVGRENGAMNSNQLKAYAFTDLNAFAGGGFLYYRIKQVDKSGKFEYTDVKVVKVPTLAVFAVKSFPNPVTHKLNVSWGQDAKAATYSLNDVSGKTWISGRLVNSQEIDVTRLPIGVYILNVKTGDQIYREKIIKN